MKVLVMNNVNGYDVKVSSFNDVGGMYFSYRHCLLWRKVEKSDCFSMSSRHCSHINLETLVS